MREGEGPDPSSSPDQDDSGDVENTATPCAACAACHAKRDDVSAGQPSWEHIPCLETPEAVTAFPGLQVTSEQHVADLDGILAWYDFPEGIRVPCSLKGRHPHGYGVVVRMLCDIIICMGKVCGKKSIIGFDAVHRSVKARVQFQADERYLDGWVARYKERIADLQRPLRGRHELLATIAQHLPELHSELSRRFAKGPGGAAVEVPRAQAEETRHLAGLQLFRKTPPGTDNLERSLSRFDAALRDAPPVDGPAAAALLRMAKAADERADAAQEWVRETAGFLTEQNLALALVALRRENASVQAEGDGIRVRYMPGRSALLTYPDARSRSTAGRP